MQRVDQNSLLTVQETTRGGTAESAYEQRTEAALAVRSTRISPQQRVVYRTANTRFPATTDAHRYDPDALLPRPQRRRVQADTGESQRAGRASASARVRAPHTSLTTTRCRTTHAAHLAKQRTGIAADGAGTDTSCGDKTAITADQKKSNASKKPKEMMMGYAAWTCWCWTTGIRWVEIGRCATTGARGIMHVQVYSFDAWAGGCGVMVGWAEVSAARCGA